MGVVLLVAQGVFLSVFIVRALFGRRALANDGAARAQATRTAPRAGALLMLHAIGIGLVSLGIAQTFVAQRDRFLASLRVLVGLGCVVAASALAAWALRVFRSWRLLARVDAGHGLCIEGPYRLVRHPIYLAMDLWAVGSALTCPAPAAITGMVIVFLGSDLRARAEEQLLLDVFGDDYRSYAARVRRVLPGIY
jgi:protein-S-isoprenylcysteine O-methyltransferase Ste14